ncbi:MAG: hypothetical protein COB08_009595 [Rhodobacteraceae bacterium]|nr:hypothetical protein [Paracoccaceae bacterium]
MDAPNDDPPHLRTLRRLVNILTVVFIIGFITIVIVIVMQFARVNETSVSPELPSFTSLPASETAQAVTYGKDWIAIVTIDDDGFERIRTYGLDGTSRQIIDIEHSE